MKSAMTDPSPGPRARLFRESAILQLKLIADGFRDALLIPVSLIATVIGLVRGGEDCDAEFKRVIKLGRRSERWINLFGQQKPLGSSGGPGGQMDTIIDQVETVVTEQYRRGRSNAEARQAVRDAMAEQGDGEEAGDAPPRADSEPGSGAQ